MLSNYLVSQKSELPKQQENWANRVIMMRLQPNHFVVVVAAVFAVVVNVIVAVADHIVLSCDQ